MRVFREEVTYSREVVKTTIKVIVRKAKSIAIYIEKINVKERYTLELIHIESVSYKYRAPYMRTQDINVK